MNEAPCKLGEAGYVMVQTRVYAAEIGLYCIRTSCIDLGLSVRSIPFRVN